MHKYALRCVTTFVHQYDTAICSLNMPIKSCSYVEFEQGRLGSYVRCFQLHWYCYHTVALGWLKKQNNVTTIALCAGCRKELLLELTKPVSKSRVPSKHRQPEIPSYLEGLTAEPLHLVNARFPNFCWPPIATTGAIVLSKVTESMRGEEGGSHNALFQIKHSFSLSGNCDDDHANIILTI